jgi:1-acyl-sn-glycerol-3-phosphate acyltransferase
MKRFLYGIVYKLWYPVVIIFIGVSTTFFGIIVIIIGLIPWIDRDANFGNLIGRLWSWLNLKVAMTWVNVIGKEKIDRNRSYILMSNHQSHFDVWALIAYMPLQLRWVMKMELKHIPLFGYGCSQLGMIYIDRGDSEKARKSLDAAKEKIKKSGVSVVFFPEGTRSCDGELLEFKKGGFVMALATNTPILPVTVNGSRYALPKGRPFSMKPGRIELIVHDPVEVEGMTYEDRNDLMVKIKEIISSKMDMEYGKQY